ncbi:hypothetical protein Xcel_0499 [Xylanimonas cellulosilytica DSM 15894]|uniref:Uncharacterized protein n=1 Tax=Xylanimonas cellulosilytica (strain DSM 15894 / JCM 12276 / CECT 5975 / KCTC 9989 / LMG 20990 / NBRC 107835 / XIL07) TaxID=446471 RepID=D1BW35_XYLCX|nr:hypothetical protein [Xylanimonas cellulosilytica]ACZ29538.1 hypothetical protein Xcel_0499 [Xylanimonas cellulosilytica DSM 15894]
MNKGVYRVLYRFAFVGLIGGVVVASVLRQPWGWWLFAAGCASVAALAVWAFTLVFRSTFAGQRKLLVPDAPVASPGSPSPLDVVLADLAALNSPDVPFEVTVTREGDGALVEARWLTEEMRWRTLFTRGSQVLAWRMEVRLDAGRATYKFVEYNASAAKEALLTPAGTPGAHAAWNWKRGKTAFQFQLSGVITVGGEVETTRYDGPQSSWGGAIAIAPRDVKIPVFRTLRNHGWRPPRDTAMARMFEG